MPECRTTATECEALVKSAKRHKFTTAAQPVAGKRAPTQQALGSVAVSARAALLGQISPGQAEDAEKGRSLFKSSNTAWRDLARNPKGRACFAARLRYSPLIWNDQTSRLLPCLAAKRAPARP